MKRAYEILTGWEVYADLAPDGRIDLGEQRGRNLDKRYSAQIGRGSKAGQVSDHPATQGDDCVGSLKSRTGDKRERLFQRTHRLVLLTFLHQPMPDREVSATKT